MDDKLLLNNISGAQSTSIKQFNSVNWQQPINPLVGTLIYYPSNIGPVCLIFPLINNTSTVW
jgi:hypothetical protein